MAPVFSTEGSSLASGPGSCAFWPSIARSPDGAALQHTTSFVTHQSNFYAATHPGKHTRRHAQKIRTQVSSARTHLCSTVLACSSCTTPSTTVNVLSIKWLILDSFTSLSTTTYTSKTHL